VIKAIDTKYKGYKFRSRLEARFAVFLDALDIKWDYEIEGFNLPSTGLYLPDFFLHKNGLCGYYKGPLWIEIKATKPTVNEINKLRELAVRTRIPGAFFCGSPSIHIPNHFKEWFEDYYNGLSVPVLDYFQYPLSTFVPDSILSHPADIHDQFLNWICRLSGETDIEKLRIGAKAALSARFEFGESG